MGAIIDWYRSVQCLLYVRILTSALIGVAKRSIALDQKLVVDCKNDLDVQL